MYALALAVGLVLADSSIVVLALPEIFRDFDTSISGVSWVLVSYNLVIALAAVPGAMLARNFGPGRSAGVGLAVFAGGSLACGLATELTPLIAARAIQALGGAVAVTAALELLVVTAGGDRSAIRVWVAAGAIGAAVGPGVGGLLTELVSWQSIFLMQVPLAIAAGVPLLGVVASETREWTRPTRGVGAPDEGNRPHVPANVALALASAGIAATLFLVVLMLIEGWRLTPIEAALVVSVVPLATLVGGRLGGRVSSPKLRAAAGSILLGGGLAALGLLPGPEVAWLILPQLLAGLGLALVLSALTEVALEGRSSEAVHGGWTIAARHAGVVVGLLLLTPVFTHELEAQRDAALEAGTNIVLESTISPAEKVELGTGLSEELARQGERVPDLGPVFEPYVREAGDAESRASFESLEADLQDQLERAATHAFSSSFLISAVLALLALVPIGMARRIEL